MNPDIKHAFIAALHSGEYEKTTGALAEDYSSRTPMQYYKRYCAVGVLCDMAVKAGIATETVVKIPDWSHNVYNYDGCGGRAPQSVLDWAGMSKREEIMLEKFNDNNEVGFSTIANWIEKHL